LNSITDDTQESHVSDIPDGSAPSGLRARLERYERSAGGGIQALVDDPGSESRAEPDPAPVSDADESISPELALVDPELAARARARLPDPRPFAPLPEVEPDSNRVVLADLPPPAEPAPLTVPKTRTRKRRVAKYLLGLVVLAAAAGAIAYLGPLDRISGNDSAAPGSENTALPNVPASEPPPPQSAEPPAAVAAPRAFSWAPVRGAASYLVQFYRGRTEIFRARPTEARIVVPARWSYKGHDSTLRPGRYRWSVRPRLGGQAHQRYGKPIVLSQLVVQRSSSGGGQSTRSP
jgi:hypothetical protein